jgi:hypothetical protein
MSGRVVATPMAAGRTVARPMAAGRGRVAAR